MKKGNPNPNPATRFGAGNRANPGGKPVNARNRITAKFLDVLSKDFDEHGEAAIIATRKEDPVAYVKVVSALLPKEVVLDKRPLEDLTDDQLRDLLARLDGATAGAAPSDSERADTTH